MSEYTSNMSDKTVRLTEWGIEIREPEGDELSISLTPEDLISLGQDLISSGRRARPRYYAQMRVLSQSAYVLDRGADGDEYTIVATFEGPDCLTYAERHAAERNGESN